MAVDITILRNRVKALEAAKAADEARIVVLEARPTSPDLSDDIVDLTARLTLVELELANPS